MELTLTLTLTPQMHDVFLWYRTTTQWFLSVLKRGGSLTQRTEDSGQRTEDSGQRTRKKTALFIRPIHSITVVTSHSVTTETPLNATTRYRSNIHCVYALIYLCCIWLERFTSEVFLTPVSPSVHTVAGSKETDDAAER